MKRLIVLLRVIRAGLFAAVPLAALFLWVTKPQLPTLIPSAVAPTTTELTQASTRELSWYAPLWERDWKQPPIPPAPAPPPATPDPRPLPILLATLVEPSGQYAHFLGPSGRAELKAPAESIGGYRIRAIEPGRVELQDGQRSFWVEVPKPQAARR